MSCFMHEVLVLKIKKTLFATMCSSQFISYTNVNKIS